MPIGSLVTGAAPRSTLAAQGLSLDVEYTQFYQGLLSGDGNDDWDLGGRVDAFFNIDTERLGLWKNGGIRTHTEYRYGSLTPFRGGALWPVNTAALLPLGPGDEIVVSSIFLTQSLGEHVNIMLGKINAVDMLAGDPFFGGWGTQRFQNIAFVAPPSGVVPPTIMGAVATIKTDPILWTLMAFDPSDRTNDYWPDDLFDNGVNFSVGATYVTTLAGRTTSIGVNGTYSTKDGADLGELLLPTDLKTGANEGSYNVSLQFSHFLKQHSERLATDGASLSKRRSQMATQTPCKTASSQAWAARGCFASRRDDTFGVGLLFL